MRQHVAIVTGCTSGLGKEIATSLCASGWAVHGFADTAANGLMPPDEIADIGLKMYHPVDIRWPEDVLDAVLVAAEEHGGEEEFELDALINCAGLNYLSPFESFRFDKWEELMDVNAKALAILTRTCLPFLANPADPLNGGTVINIVSNAAHVPMTHSLAYNVSKAAALMVTKQLARELFKSHGITVFSISPNKMRGTKMSREIEAAVPALRGWTPEEAEAYQRAALPTGMETDPARVAEFVTFLLSQKERHIYLHGCDIPYGG